MRNIELIKGECLKEMEKLIDMGVKVDMILCDLPYGTTAQKWDKIIDFDKLWGLYKQLITDRGAIVLFAQTPFDKMLGASNPAMLKYEWIWDKGRPTGFLNAKFAPLKRHENILVFGKSAAGHVKDKERAMLYHPQFRRGKPYTTKSKGNSTNYGRHESTPTVNDGEHYYPVSVLNFKTETGLHPTQKPVPLLEYLIRTYTDEGMTVLDNCMGSGSTGVACVITDRKFIGIELSDKYFEIAKDRIEYTVGSLFIDE